MTAAFVDVVFDGPPAHESGRFVEVEDPEGRGIKAGEWIDRGNGLWALRIAIRESSLVAALVEALEESRDVVDHAGGRFAGELLARIDAALALVRSTP